MASIKKMRFSAPEEWSTGQHLLVFLLVILPIALFGFFSVTRTYQDITRAIIIKDTQAAFDVREEAMRSQLLVYGLAQLMALIGAYLVIQLIRSYGEKERELGARSRLLEKEVYDQTQELREKIEALERLNRLMVNRELSMVALKNELAELHGRKPQGPKKNKRTP